MRRLETIPRGQGVDNGLAARVHDPLWLLARQWQFGEFRAEDAASPAFVDLEAEVHVLDRWRPRGAGDPAGGATPEDGWRPYRPGTEPLEKVVEAEPVTAPDPRLRLEGGLRLTRLLDAAGLGDLLAAFLARCPFPDQEAAATSGGQPVEGATAAGPPAPTAGTLAAAVRRRVPDGALLARSLGRLAADPTAGTEADALGVPEAARAPLGAVAADWLDWWAPRAPAAAGVEGSGGGGHPGRTDGDQRHPAAWDEHRLEYAFEVTASTLPGIALGAENHPGGRVDWWAMDVTAAADAPGQAEPRAPLHVRGVPAPARFGGMPVPRFWEMEDARFDPGSIDAAASDLGRLLMATFATVYGNDWFVLPVRLPVASLTRVAAFTVTDVFGRTAPLGPAGAADDGWNLFGLTDTEAERAPGGERPTSEWFLLAPALPEALEGGAAETVLLLRDEMANLAWAVEAAVTDDAGGIVDRFAVPATAPATPGPTTGIGRYRVDTPVPDHWFPLAAEARDGHESVVLHLVPLARRVGGEVTTQVPLGALLARARGGGDLWLHEEEVPRAGAAVVRHHHHARWHDGSVHTWIGRRVTTGGGEGSSGLRFDAVEPSPPS